MRQIYIFLHGVNASNLFSIISTTSTPLKNQLETRFNDVQAIVASLVEWPRHKRGRSKIEHRATHVCQSDNVPRDVIRVAVKVNPPAA